MDNSNLLQTVLVVDDSIENIDVLSGILGQEYNVRFAKSGAMAIKLAEKIMPDIILLDIMMPELDGYEVCKIIKENIRTKNIPIIFVSAKDQEFDEVKGFSLGAVDYITKPISALIVKARVKTHLSLYDQQKVLDQQVRDKTEQLYSTRLEIINKLSKAAEYNDNDTGLHVTRMSKYAYIIAKEYGFSENDAEMLLNVAPMHDVGKIGISDSILQKPGALSKDEWDIMKSHTTIGAEIIASGTSEILQLAGIVAIQHHEKWDGSGYPNGLRGSKININARIVAVADVFDALTSKRPYKEAWDTNRAIETIKEEAGHHFDPEVVNSFISGIEEIILVKDKYMD